MTLAGPGGSTIGREDAFTCAAALSSLIRRLGKDPDNATNRSLALDAIRQVVEEFNLERGWWDRLRTEVIDLAANDPTYPLPDYFRNHLGRAWLNDTSGDRTIPISVLGYQEFLARVSFEGVEPGHTRFLTINETRISTGELLVWPTPGTDDVALYPTIDFPCFLDIPICKDTGEALPVSGALSGAIYAKALFLLNDYIGTEERSVRYERNAATMYLRAIAFDNKMKASNQSYLRGYYGGAGATA